MTATPTAGPDLGILPGQPGAPATAKPVVAVEPARRAPVVLHPPPRPPGRDESDRTRPLRPDYLPSAVLTMVGMLATAMVVTVAILGPLRHARDQSTAFDTLRGQLADGTAPVNQVVDGTLLPPGTPLGTIDIPQLGVREVFFEGTTSAVTRSGPGHLRSTPLPGQAGESMIVGRAAGFGGPFGALGTLAQKSVFYVTTGQAERMPFRVVDVRRAGDPKPAPLKAGQARLTLVTASGTPFLPDGTLLVDADLVGPVQPAGPRYLTHQLLPVSERPLQGEQSAWVPVIALGQLLLLGVLVVTWFRYRWGRWQVWLTGGPVLVALTLAVTDQLARLLPNLL